MKTPIVVVFFLLIATNLNAQTYQWTKSFGGTDLDYSSSITVDKFGNVYTTGWFKGLVDFDPGPGTASLYSNSSAMYDVFVQKMDPFGNFLWAKSFGWTGLDQGHSLAVDNSGNVYTTGIFQGTVDFDPGVGITNLTAVGGDDVFIQKMDSSGNFLWAKSFGGYVADKGYSITIDNFGNVYTAGSFDFFADFDPGPGTFILNSGGSKDAFIHKMDSLGNFLWVKAISGNGNQYSIDITTDTFGNIYTIGTSQGTADFDPGPGVSNLTSVGVNDVYVQKLDASGNFLWAKTFGGTLADYGSSLAVDKSGNVYTTGMYRGTADFNPGAGIASYTSIAGDDDMFVHKMDSSGNFLWVKTFGGTPGSIYENASTIVVDDTSNVYISGWFEGTIDFDPNSGTANQTAVGFRDVFIQKLDSSGNFLWVKTFGGTHEEKAYSIFVDSIGNIITTGTFSDTVDFDPGTGIANLIAVGSYDVFVQKINQCIPTSAQTVVIACDTYTWPSNSSIYTATGTYSCTYLNSTGCVHTQTLDLIINHSSVSNVNLTYCDVYTWPCNGFTYSTSGIFTCTYLNATSCIHTQTLNLIINNSSTGNTNVTACDAYTWPCNGLTYTNSGLFTCTYLNAAACVHTQVLDLTINNSTSSVINVTACNTYTWPCNGMTYTVSGLHTCSYLNTAGCIHTQILDLVINSVSDLAIILTGGTIIALNPNATYQWIDCDHNYSLIPGETFQSFSPTSNGSYAVELGENGCVDTSNCQNVTILDVTTYDKSTLIRVYPNPASDELSIDVNLQDNDNGLFTIYDITGRKRMVVKLTANQDRTQISIKELEAGLYTYTYFVNNQKLGAGKLIKE